MPSNQAVRVGTNKWLVAASLGFGAVMATIDSSIVNVAMPEIRGSLGATIQEITWIGTGYAVAMVVVMPLTAFIGRLFGQKRTYLFCLALFIAGSAACGFAGSLVSLVIFRVLQGMGGGALLPSQQAILRQTFPPREQGMAMALFSVVVILGPAIGPTLGGYIVDNWHWSWIFFINLPIGVTGWFMVTAFVHEDPEIVAANHHLAERQRRSVDWLGITLMTVGLAALEYVLEEGTRDDWFESQLITALFLVAVICLVGFVIRELTAPVPAVDLRLFRDPVFASGTVITALLYMVLLSTMFLLPVFMQELLGFTAMQSGMVMMPRAAVMLLAMPIVGRLYNHVSPRIFGSIGITVTVIGSWQTSRLTLASGAGDVVVAILLQGLGFAAMMVPMTTVALTNVPRHRLADATGLNSLVRQLGAAVGLAVCGTLVGNYAVEARTSMAAHVTEVSPLVQQRLAFLRTALAGRGMDAASARRGAMAALQGLVTRQSMMLSFERLFLFVGLVFLVAFPLLIFLKVRREEGAGEVPRESKV